MPEVQSSQPGRFCWFENGTTDVAAAKRFYQSLFDWTFDDRPMGPNGTYTMLRRNGKDVGGLYQMDAEMLSAGLPAHWMPYVATASADESVDKVKKNGGTVMNGPFDVMEQGRMAVLQDPQGAAFAVWEPKAHSAPPSASCAPSSRCTSCASSVRRPRSCSSRSRRSSMLIRQLEEGLGTRLFDRTTRSLQPRPRPTKCCPRPSASCATSIRSRPISASSRSCSAAASAWPSRRRWPPS